MLISCRDILLLETGFLTILLAPLRPGSSGSHDGLMMWLVRWLLFRLMFASGIVKLTSHCPTWWELTGKQVIVNQAMLSICSYILLQIMAGLV